MPGRKSGRFTGCLIIEPAVGKLLARLGQTETNDASGLPGGSLAAHSRAANTLEIRSRPRFPRGLLREDRILEALLCVSHGDESLCGGLSHELEHENSFPVPDFLAVSIRPTGIPPKRLRRKCAESVPRPIHFRGDVRRRIGLPMPGVAYCCVSTPGFEIWQRSADVLISAVLCKATNYHAGMICICKGNVVDWLYLTDLNKVQVCDGRLFATIAASASDSLQSGFSNKRGDSPTVRCGNLYTSGGRYTKQRVAPTGENIS